jgi:hypothetical protein
LAADRHRSAVSFRPADSFAGRQHHQPQAYHNDDDATGTCSRGNDGMWCAARKKVTLPDGTSTVLPAPTPRAFCTLDESIIGRCLTDPDGTGNDLPGLWSRLHEALAERTVTGTAIRMPYGPSEPLSLSADSLLRLISSSVRTWHARTAAAARLTPPDRALDPLSREAVTASSRTLSAHLSAFLALAPAPMARPFPMKPVKPRDARLQPRGGRLVAAELEAERGHEEVLHIGEDFVILWTDDPDHTSGATAGNEILRLHYAARSVLQETRTRPVELLGVPCRSCDRKALRRAEPSQHDGDPEFWSVCGGCGDLLPLNEYTEWVNLNAAWLRGRLTPAQIAAGMKGSDAA